MGKHAATGAARWRYAGWVPFLCVLAAIVVLSASAISWVLTQRTPTVQDSPVAQSRLTTHRISIPALHVTAPIINVGTAPDGAVQVPRNPKVAGWWDGGASPGAPIGTAVIAGHLNASGVTGALAHIGTLSPGSTVYVYGTRDGTRTRLAFTVTGVRTYLEHSLPSEEVFDQRVVGRLVLLTCGGPFDARTGNYQDTIVTYAVPA